MSFDLVIVTRNRQSVLPLSLRTMLTQSLLPRRLIVVDSSDKHAEMGDLVRRVVDSLTPSLDRRIVHSEPGIPHQRNVGLPYVVSPVVLFAEDDMLWFPGVAEAIVRIFARDAEKAVGCITPLYSRVPPPGVFGDAPPPYKLTFHQRMKNSLITAAIVPLERRLFPDPVHTGPSWKSTWGARVCPHWLQEEDAESCGPVLGGSMTFRTDVIRALGGFDELMGGINRYALFEDKDASLGSLKRNLNVVARRARVFHYKEPSARMNGSEFGATSILNRAYVVSKHSLPRSAARRHLRRYCYYQLFKYLLRAHTAYGRARFAGAVRAMAFVGQLTRASGEDLPARYAEAQTSLTMGQRATQ